jgi:hypothetical protein
MFENPELFTQPEQMPFVDGSEVAVGIHANQPVVMALLIIDQQRCHDHSIFFGCFPAKKLHGNSVDIFSTYLGLDRKTGIESLREKDEIGGFSNAIDQMAEMVKVHLCLFPENVGLY